MQANQRSNEPNSASHSINYHDTIAGNMNNESEYLFQLAYDKELNHLKKMSTRNEKLMILREWIQ